MSESSADAQSGSGMGNMRRPRLKYQVFVSSTYVDLHKERERVVWAVLEARHIPAGMENFTATDERGWKTITRVIDDTDYYVLIIGGLYGSIDPATGISWTQREYEYATSKKIPVLAFIRDQAAIPGDMVERDAAKMPLLQKFIERVRKEHLYKTWKAADDLAAGVASALRNHIQDDEDDGRSRPGWVRGDTIPSLTSLDEFARLSSENARLKGELESLRSGALLPVLELVSGSDESPFEELVLARPILQSLSRHHGPLVFKFLLQRTNSAWLALAIKNTGKVAARNVTIDFQFAEAADIHLTLVNPGKAMRDAEGVELTNPANHCYVGSRSSKSIRQRVKLVAPGISEPLVPFGVEFTGEAAKPGEEKSLACTYAMADENGASVRGQFLVRVRWTEARDVQLSLHLLPNSPLQD